MEESREKFKPKSAKSNLTEIPDFSVKLLNVQSLFNQNPARYREKSQYENCSPNLPLKLLFSQE